MVVVEFPLWVVHSAEASGAGASSSSSSQHRNQSREAQALGMLKTRKSALYGVDCHPDGTRFATAGGDGTVRIWSTGPLFQNKHRAKLAASTAGDDNRNGLASQANSNSLTVGGGGLATSFVSSSSSSSGSDEDDLALMEKGNGNPQKSDNAESKSSSSSDEDEQVHDLSGLVRRKKDGQVAASPSMVTASQPAKATPKSPGTAKQHHSHNSKEPARLLATLSAHTGSSVLAVRFSTTGKYLASAGDDAVVCIHERSATATAASGNLTGHANHHHHHAHSEHWVRIHCCRGHGLDVVDLTWAPDDSYLVSCSLDSQTPIIVWKVAADGDSRTSNSRSIIKQPFKILGQGIHTSMVKGVSFDPAGSYIASSGDDPAICIFRAHDDWGLEQRIDASSGIFRQWHANEDAVSLSSQSLFRRISWASDGAFLCSTNSVVKNKHVASTISRERWSVSSASHASAGAANLVGHKQPIVVSRHAPQMLSAKKRRTSNSGEDEMDIDADDENEDEEPQHAMLLALGDKRGFVTVWSTKKSRPIFKLQCSESRCTVTDLSWLKIPTSDDLVLMVSLLDGQLVAVKFAVPAELGQLLSKKEQARVFQLRYGIDADDGRLIVGRSTGLKIVENPLQMTLEERVDDMDDDIPFPDDEAIDVDNVPPKPQQTVAPRQKESIVQGKKRIQPMLLSNVSAPDKRPRAENTREKEQQERRKSIDPVQNALEAAEKASSAVQATTAQREKSDDDAPSAPKRAESDVQTGGISYASDQTASRVSFATSACIPHSTERAYYMELPLLKGPASLSDAPVSYVAECVNSTKVPVSSVGSSVPCVDITIRSAGKMSWKDQIAGTSCCAVASSQEFLAIGTCDGTIQLYSTSSSLGWACGIAFRSHPAVVIGQPPVTIRLMETKAPAEKLVDMLIVTTDGGFAVYGLIPQLTLRYKGTVLPAMTHMTLSSSGRQGQVSPKLSRIQITESGHLLMLLSLSATASRPATNVAGNIHAKAIGPENVGGSLQAFVYNTAAELWMRVSDSRFLLSDLYSVLPSRSSDGQLLSQWDDLVRMGSLQSQLKATRRLNTDGGAGRTIYNQEEEGIFEATRIHCEDRLACAIAFAAAQDFEHWLRLYIRTLTRAGQVDILRIVIDMLKTDDSRPLHGSDTAYWWMSQATTIFGLDRTGLLNSIVIPELGKNRSLQRLTNEIALEVACL